MKLTIRLDDDLIVETQKRAVRSGLTLSAVIEQALRESFSKSRDLPVRLPAWGQGGVLPGIDLDDSASMLDLIDRP